MSLLCGRTVKRGKKKSASGDVRETAGEEREKRGEVPRKKACTLRLNDTQVNML